MTLLEMMTVVAIIGILSSIGGGALFDMVVAGRVVSSSKGLMAMLGTARLRAATSNCPHYVQVNGPTYAGAGSTGFVTGPATLSLMRKGSCTSAKAAFEPGDKLVDSDNLGPAELPNAVQLALPTAMLSSGVLAGQGFTIGYDRLGGRSVWFDSAGAGEIGFSEVTGLGDATFTLHENATTPAHLLVVVLPTAGAARLQ
jgi:prepilin-type N-terminal cleavage/methylation domain-containing protein